MGYLYYSNLQKQIIGNNLLEEKWTDVINQLKREIVEVIIQYESEHDDYASLEEMVNEALEGEEDLECLRGILESKEVS